MIYSLNEIDTHCKKAARGAGFEWGHAEDVGKAIRWLAAFELPGTAVLAAYLKERDDNPAHFCQPDVGYTTCIKDQSEGYLCPVLTGAWLCDSAVIEKTSCIQIEKLSFPLLLMPFLAQIANSIQQTLTFEYQSTRLLFSGGILNSNDDDSLCCVLTENATITINAKAVEGKPAAVIGQTTAIADWQYLNQYAFKTYVPATEASRLGAGPAE